MPRYDDDYYPPSEAPVLRELSPRPASPGYTNWPAEPQYSQAVQVRPRSQPPSWQDPGRRARSIHRRRDYYDRDHYDHYDSSDSDHDHDRSPIMDRAREFASDNFSNSRAGLGVGILGAVVGGLAAREANKATSRYTYDGEDPRDEAIQHRNQMISTVFGAAVGAIGANAVEKRFEARRERDMLERDEKERERERERRFRRRYSPSRRSTSVSPTKQSHTYHDQSGRPVIETREVRRRPRSGSSRGHGDDGTRRSSSVRDPDPWDRRTRGGSGLERQVDPDARSWRDVEDWVYDDRKSGGTSRDGYEIV